MESETFREALAALQHNIWSHWMEYLFRICTRNADGSYTIPPDKVERWQRQMHTEYVHLSEEERESDREQADRVINFLKIDR